MAESARQEIHSYLDDLCRQHVYGSVTFFFKDGEITLVKDQLEYNTREIVESYSGIKPRRVLVIPKKRIATNEESHINEGEKEVEGA
jgi:hypothetical protein